jgi:antitoxin (DNA-binding transcriptional repressor) of toxin-antitoxin stability system
MKSVNVHEAKTNFSSLLTGLEGDGQTVVICRNGRPVADLVPHRRASRIKTHPDLGNLKIEYDPVEPLAGDEWPGKAR